MKMRSRRARFNRRYRVITFRIPAWVAEAIDSQANRGRYQSVDALIADIFWKASHQIMQEPTP